MSRALKRKLAIAVAVAALLTGGSIAAVTASGQNAPQPGAHRAARQRARLLSSAASYLGISAAQLRRQLQSGKTLAQVAAGTPGKTQNGLIEALTAVRRAQLQKAGAKVAQRVSAEVNRPLLGANATSSTRVASAARLYLGLSVAQLKADRSAGKTLAQIAAATPGKSEAGLIEALVTARTKRLETALSAGRLTKSAESARLAKLPERVKRAVDRLPAKKKSG